MRVHRYVGQGNDRFPGPELFTNRRGLLVVVVSIVGGVAPDVMSAHPSTGSDGLNCSLSCWRSQFRPQNGTQLAGASRFTLIDV